MTRIIIYCTILILTACSGGDAAETTATADAERAEKENTTQSSTSAVTSRKAMSSLQLNDGQAWKADEEMVERVAAMQEVLEKNRSTEEIDGAAVAKALDHHTGKFIASCTMKGQGHEELHKWLEPYMKLIQKLEKAKSEAEEKEIMDELSQMLKTFGEYFE